MLVDKLLGKVQGHLRERGDQPDAAARGLRRQQLRHERELRQRDVGGNVVERGQVRAQIGQVQRVQPRAGAVGPVPREAQRLEVERAGGREAVGRAHGQQRALGGKVHVGRHGPEVALLVGGRPLAAREREHDARAAAPLARTKHTALAVQRKPAPLQRHLDALRRRPLLRRVAGLRSVVPGSCMLTKRDSFFAPGDETHRG